MNYYSEHNKAISVRVNAEKYDLIVAHNARLGRWNSAYKSIADILDEAMTEFISKNKISKPKTIKGQTKIHFDNVEMYIQEN